MKYIFLCMFLGTCTQAMENNERISTIVLDVTIHTAQGKMRISPDDLPTQFLMKGVDWSDLPLVQKGIALKGFINYVDFRNEFHSLIQRACKDKSAAMVAELLKAPNIDIHACREKTTPAFLLAASREDEEGDKIVDLLLAHDLHILDACDKDGNSILHTTCIQANHQAIKTLLKKGARTTLKNNFNQTPLAAGYLQNPNFKNIYSPDLKKLVSRDKKGNTQLHWAALIDDSINETFDDYIAFLVSQGLSLYTRNKKKMLPINLVFHKYNVRYKMHMTTKLDYTYALLTQTEMILHSFLRCMHIAKPCALFREILQYQDKDNCQLPKELQTYIACLYYALNRETIIAKKYKNNVEYYGKTLQEKNEIKNLLFKKPEPHLLWSA